MTNEYPPEKTAGTAMSTQCLAEEVAGRGYRVTVVVNTRQTAPPHESVGNVDVIRLRPLGVPMTRMAQRAALLVGIARRLRPDVIQGQSLSCGFLALVAGHAVGVPAVTSVQGYDLYNAGAWAKRTYISWALSRSDRVVTVTDDIRAKAMAVCDCALDVIPNGFRRRPAHALDRHAARVRLGVPQEGTVILFVGRLARQKGVAHLIRAMPGVRAQVPDVRLLIVGEGETKPELLALTAQLGLEAVVMFAGARPHEDVIGLMRASDLFVLPSLTEPFGIVLVEAMSCGLPIVASNVMGIPSIVGDGINGVLVPPGSATELCERIAGVLTDPAQREAMSRRNIDTAAQFEMSRVADRYLRVWMETVTRYRSRRPGLAPRGYP